MDHNGIFCPSSAEFNGGDPEAQHSLAYLGHQVSPASYGVGQEQWNEGFVPLAANSEGRGSHGNVVSQEASDTLLQQQYPFQQYQTYYPETSSPTAVVSHIGRSVPVHQLSSCQNPEVYFQPTPGANSATASITSSYDDKQPTDNNGYLQLEPQQQYSHPVRHQSWSANPSDLQVVPLELEYNNVPYYNPEQQSMAIPDGTIPVQLIVYNQHQHDPGISATTVASGLPAVAYSENWTLGVVAKEARLPGDLYLTVGEQAELSQNDIAASMKLQEGKKKIDCNVNVVAKEETLRSSPGCSFPSTKPRETSLKQGGKGKGRKQAENDRTEGEKAYRSVASGHSFPFAGGGSRQEEGRSFAGRQVATDFATAQIATNHSTVAEKRIVAASFEQAETASLLISPLGQGRNNSIRSSSTSSGSNNGISSCKGNRNKGDTSNNVCDKGLPAADWTHRAQGQSLAKRTTSATRTVGSTSKSSLTPTVTSASPITSTVALRCESAVNLLNNISGDSTPRSRTVCYQQRQEDQQKQKQKHKHKQQPRPTSLEEGRCGMLLQDDEGNTLGGVDDAVYDTTPGLQQVGNYSNEATNIVTSPSTTNAYNNDPSIQSFSASNTVSTAPISGERFNPLSISTTKINNDHGIERLTASQSSSNTSNGSNGGHFEAQPMSPSTPYSQLQTMFWQQQQQQRPSSQENHQQQTTSPSGRQLLHDSEYKSSASSHSALTSDLRSSSSAWSGKLPGVAHEDFEIDPALSTTAITSTSYVPPQVYQTQGPQQWQQQVPAKAISAISPSSSRNTADGGQAYSNSVQASDSDRHHNSYQQGYYVAPPDYREYPQHRPATAYSTSSSSASRPTSAMSSGSGTSEYQVYYDHMQQYAYPADGSNSSWQSQAPNNGQASRLQNPQLQNRTHSNAQQYDMAESSPSHHQQRYDSGSQLSYNVNETHMHSTGLQASQTSYWNQHLPDHPFGQDRYEQIPVEGSTSTSNSQTGISHPSVVSVSVPAEANFLSASGQTGIYPASEYYSSVSDGQKPLSTLREQYHNVQFQPEQQSHGQPSQFERRYSDPAGSPLYTSSLQQGQSTEAAHSMSMPLYFDGSADHAAHGFAASYPSRSTAEGFESAYAIPALHFDYSKRGNPQPISQSSVTKLDKRGKRNNVKPNASQAAARSTIQTQARTTSPLSQTDTSLHFRSSASEHGASASDSGGSVASDYFGKAQKRSRHSTVSSSYPASSSIQVQASGDNAPGDQENGHSAVPEYSAISSQCDSGNSGNLLQSYHDALPRLSNLQLNGAGLSLSQVQPNTFSLPVNKSQTALATPLASSDASASPANAEDIEGVDLENERDDGDTGISNSGRRLYECKTCGRKFPRPSALIVHERIHSGEKPFICEFCDRPFTVASNLRRHQKIHAKQSKAASNQQAEFYEDSQSSNGSTIKGPPTNKAKHHHANNTDNKDGSLRHRVPGEGQNTMNQDIHSPTKPQYGHQGNTTLDRAAFEEGRDVSGVVSKDYGAANGRNII